MSTERQQDAGMDRLLRAALEPGGPVNAEGCPAADTVAAYAEGVLTARERADLEPHLASCARCQAVLAVMARDASEGAGPSKGAAWTAWLSIPRLRWLVPAGAAALAIVLYVAVKPEPAAPGRPDAGFTAAAPSPEFTVAQRSEQAARPLDELARSDKRQADRPQGANKDAPRQPDTPAGATAGGKSASRGTEAESRAAQVGVPAAAAPPLPATRPAESKLSSATPQTVSQPSLTPARVGARSTTEISADAAAAVLQPMAKAMPAGAAAPSQAAATAAAAGNVAMAPPAAERQKGEATTGLEGLWNEADFVVRARALGTREEFPEKEGATGFDVLEVFKRHDRIPPAQRFVVAQAGGEAAGQTTIDRAANRVPIRAGAEYVLFLKRSSSQDSPERLNIVGTAAGLFRLDGDRVVIGSGVGQAPATSRAELLARLRQFAGTARR